MGIAEEILHVFPIDDTEIHILEVGREIGQFEDGSFSEMLYCKCKCCPVHEFHGNVLIVTHNSFDGREGVEWANEILNT